MIPSRHQTERLVLVLALVLALAPSVRILSAAEVSFRRDCACSAAIVRLSDVADVKGTPAEIEALENIGLFPAPEAGAVRALRAREVQELLTLHGVDARSVRFTGSSMTNIRAIADGVEVQPGIRKAMASPVVQVSASKPVVEKIEKPVEETLVVATARPLKRGEILQRGDVVLKSFPAGKVPAGKLTQLDDVVGREILRACNTGDLLEASALRRPILVQRGETVSVILRGNGVHVSSTAQALEEGGLGSLVTLQSLLNRKDKFTARVIDFHTVEIMAPSAVVSAPQP